MAETAKDLIYQKKTYSNASGIELPEVGQQAETFLKPLLRLGTAAVPVHIKTAGIPLVDVYATTALTDGATYTAPVMIDYAFTGAGQVGGGIYVNVELDVAVGGYVNGAYIRVDCVTSGRASGLLSVVCAEMVMPASTPGAGSYAIMELEIVCPANWTGTNDVYCFWIEASGTTKTNFDTYGVLFYIKGMASGALKFWYDHDGTAGGDTVGEWVKVKTPSGVRYLGLYDAQH